MWTESYPAMEFRHGPVAVTGQGSVIWTARDVARRAPRSEEIAAAGGTAAWVSSEEPMAELVRVHRLALALARARGLDPDRPRNLTRSVILEPR